jgi:hypothetical protein
VALFAAAGLFMGGVAMPSAKAADLGGDCCADLEERVAELEATTARKGNRKMSLTITGQVNRMVTWYDDGHGSQTYYGLDNTNSSSRFILLGEAKVNSYVKMGFEIMIEIEAGGTSSKVSQLDEDGKVGSQIGGPGSFNQSNVDAYFGDARRVAWWLEHKDLGRLTIGRYDSAGVIQTIDLGGVGAVASSSFILINGGYFIRGGSGQFYAMNWGNIGDPAASQGRAELVRYDSPSWNGFIYSASVAEAGDYWGTMLRYAGEFSGFRVAAGLGYESVSDKQTPSSINVLYDAASRPSVEAWGGGLSVMHVPTGLFVQGHYNAITFGDGSATDGGACSPSAGGACVSSYWGQTTTKKQDVTHWLVQAGIAKNWFGIGNTALYGEYGKATGWGASTDPSGRTFTNDGLTAVNGVIDTDLTIWGVGITQNVDAAASTLYLGYRNFDADITCRSTLTNCGGAGSAAGTVNKLDTETTHVVAGGAIVRF